MISDNPCFEQITASSNPVCYSAKEINQSGVFAFPKKGDITAIKLSHVSGHVSCGRKSNGVSYWGCKLHIPTELMTLVTDSEKNVVFPNDVPRSGATPPKSYTLHGYNHLSLSLIFRPGNEKPYHVEKGDELHIWYSEVLQEESLSDNSGSHCVQVYVQYLDPLI